MYERRTAFANAYPFSARIVGHGNSFLYRQGILCVLYGSLIRISDIHSASESLEFNLHSFLRPRHALVPNELTCSLLYYSDGILSVHLEPKENRNPGYIFAIGIQSGNAEHGVRLIKEIPLESKNKLFTRHTSSILYYGTHPSDDWEIRAESLDPSINVPEAPLQLEEFYGSDLGITVAFEIHDGYFYALSNQICFELEELDWTSFYHCVRFPLDKPSREHLEFNQNIYRRQHAEGPIHDSWTDLSIQVDERTNEPIIVEARREWQMGTSKQVRAFYMSKIDFGDKGANKNALPEDDPFSALVGPNNKPHYAPWKERKAWNVHPEFGPECVSQRSFVLSRTKLRAYAYSSSCFVDLVEDDRCCSDSPIPCLRLRVGSRRPAPEDYIHAPRGGFGSSIASSSKAPVGSPPTDDDSVEDLDDDDVLKVKSYRHSEIKMWPPPAARCPCSRRLHNIISPPDANRMASRQITGFVDERSLVYMVKYGRSYGAEDDLVGTIVVVDFSRDLRNPISSRRQEQGQQQQVPYQSKAGGKAPVAVPQFNGSDTNAHVDAQSSASPKCPNLNLEWHWTPGQTQRCRRGEC